MLTWLLVFGVIAGLGGRVLALDHLHAEHPDSECCGHDHGHSDDDSAPDSPRGQHDHHSHACCHPAPIVGEDIKGDRLPVLTHQWLRVTWWTDLPHDGPVFELDKPPLI